MFYRHWTGAFLSIKEYDRTCVENRWRPEIEIQMKKNMEIEKQLRLKL